jgi:hypothetical protein
MAESEKTHRVVVVGAGFAGFNAGRELVRLVGATTEVVVINSTDYFPYLPLMPQVAGGMEGRARPLAAFERMSPPASIERAIQVGSQRGLHEPQSASFDWRGGRHARCHRQ